MATLSSIFLDTSILVGGLIDFGTSDHSQRILNAVARMLRGYGLDVESEVIYTAFKPEPRITCTLSGWP